MARVRIFLLLLGALASLAIAASPPTFCKCTCFTNSTIIPLGPGHEPPPANNPAPTPPSPAADDKDKNGKAVAGARRDHHPFHLDGKRAASSSCSQCNRAFCLQYHLPICKGAGEKDVVTMCFARDSQKDQIIVWAFILATAGLLGWAGAQRAMEYRERKRNVPGGIAAAGSAAAVVAGPVLGARSSRSAGLGSVRSPRGGVRGHADAADRGDYMFVQDDQGEGQSSGVGPAR